MSKCLNQPITGCLGTCWIVFWCERGLNLEGLEFMVCFWCLSMFGLGNGSGNERFLGGGPYPFFYNILHSCPESMLLGWWDVNRVSNSNRRVVTCDTCLTSAYFSFPYVWTRTNSVMCCFFLYPWVGVWIVLASLVLIYCLHHGQLSFFLPRSFQEISQEGFCLEQVSWCMPQNTCSWMYFI